MYVQYNKASFIENQFFLSPSFSILNRYQRILQSNKQKILHVAAVKLRSITSE